MFGKSLLRLRQYNNTSLILNKYMHYIAVNIMCWM